jgi:hypothetical protein
VLTRDEAARRAAHHRWFEARLFEVVGGWVTTTPEPEAKLLLEAQAAKHAWHAELWERRLRAAAVGEPGKAWTDVVEALAEPSGTVERLAGLSRVVLPHLVAAYGDHLDACNAVSDGPTARWLRVILADDVDDWRDAERLLQSLVSSPAGVERAATHTGRLWGLLVAARAASCPSPAPRYGAANLGMPVMRRVAVPAVFVAAVVLANQLDLGSALPLAARDRTPPARAAEREPERAAAVAPLTGLPAGREARVRPALAVKIDGAPLAHPHVGLDHADVVYEEPVEGITRYVAVFHSQAPEVVGPIRSVRPMDPLIVRPLHGLLAISGGIPAFVRAVGDSAELFQEGSPGYFRDGGRPAPHNLMARPAALWGAARSSGPPPPLFAYLPEGDAFGGEPATAVEVAFPGGVRAAWAWDGAAGGWARSLNGRPHTAVPGSRIVAANVVVQLVQSRATGFRGPGGGRVREVVVVGSGEALRLSQGRVVRGRWERPADTAPARFLDAGGAEVRLSPGQTWVELVPGSGSGSVTIAAPPAAVSPGPTPE